MTTPFVATPSWETPPPEPVEPGRAAPARALPFGPIERAAPARSDEYEVLGPLAPFAASGPVTDLFVNGDAGLWIDRGTGPEIDASWSATEAEVRQLAVKLIARGGRHIDEATPAVDVRLGRGIRVHAVLPPISAAGTAISIRIPRPGGFSLAALARAGMFSGDHDRALRDAVAARRNVLVTGAGGTGKTTLLAALLGEASAGERIVVIEDVAELDVAHPHLVRLEARQPNLEGTGRVGLDTLLREALRMRPDRLVVGECRGAELRELLAALNTGHDGGAGTLHANSVDDVPARLEALGSVAGMSVDAVARQAVSAFDLVAHLERRDGVRRLAGLGRFCLDRDRLAVETL
ncbi:TadA family conjugal transfer-associated ATPase [Agromyces aerolatus]|uniref:TadA family conjugal transfer-associated ATPase n=1 Tax=Agromyces sp. LY-1074 TaxID=3074080 RepID=UPI0028630DEF|nr:MULTISPECIES: TadA family conjugal transfer-associated ATPase [unclassified Agromyces]MDR5700257.1 TadA family conjugal transfer-associated ATPase [Agromyces sp. LY-1074]MDR5706765.1 TadA family conjugal transfer-associated ATPase [Agromyces sp. LY-1358]